MIRRWDKSRPPSGPFALNRDCPQAQGLVAWWPLGGASGKVFVPDLSGKHHLAPGTAPGSVTLGNDGRPALSFVAASSQYLTVGTAPVDAVPLTLTAWGKADSSTQTPIYIGGVANDNFFRIVLVSGKVRANCGTLTGPTQANAITSASYTTGAWQLFGATFASTSSRTVYLNGGNSVNETTSISPTAVNTRVFVGTGITVADAILQPWNGDLGETGVWNVALSADMHARLYNEGTRYELWYPLRSRKWMMPAAGGGAYSLTAESGSYAITGQSAGLLASRALAAGQGSYTLTGQGAALNRGYVVAAAQGSYALTGQDAGLLRGLLLTAAQGSYALSGQDVTLTYTPLGAYSLTADQGSYDLTGQSVSLLWGRALVAEHGSYALNGQDASLVYTPAGAYSLAAGQGTYALTGQDVALLWSKVLAAAQGSYTITGQDAALSRGVVLTAAQGSYTLTGQDAAFARAYVLSAGYGSYALTGQIVSLTYSGAALEALEYLLLISHITQSMSKTSKVTMEVDLISRIQQ